MTDEKRSASRASSLLSQVNAAPFVPQSTYREQKSGSSTNINAKPFTPSSAGLTNNIGGNARGPKIDNAPQGGGSTRGINASANAFVPAASNGRWSPMSAAAPGFVPGVAANGSRTARSSPQQRSEGFASSSQSYSGYDDRGGYGMPGPVPLHSPRNTPGAYPSNGYTGRGGKGRGLSPRAMTPQLSAARGGRFSIGSSQMPGGRGRGASANGAQFAGMGALGRAYHNAAVTVEELVPQLQLQPSMIHSQMSAESQAETGYPDMLQHFHSLYPLDDPKASGEQLSRVFGVQTQVMKGVDMHDMAAFAIRKFSWRQVAPSSELLLHANQVIDAWSVLGLHPNLSVPRLAFITGEIGGRPSLYLAYDFYAAAITLEAAHMQPQVTPNGFVQASVTEDAAWGYLMQLAAALRAVHSMGLACRIGLAPSKVLLLPGSRLRLGSLGVGEILAGKAARQDDVAALQREDLTSLGQLMLQLLCGSSQHPSLEQCAMYFSQDLVHIVASLLGHSQEPIVSWHQLTNALRDHAFVDLDTKHLYCDAVVNQLGKEIENGRLLRLLIKLTTITERADTDTQWAETGDRYLLKLFRDFVFHQCDEEGVPILDWAHIAEALNKVDAGLPEKIVLLSRDEASMLVVSYADIKRCLESTYGDLKKLAFSSAK